MDWKVVVATFGTIFLAELGDKTQLAVIAGVSRTGKPLSVFLGGAAALVIVTLLGALGGEALTRLVPGEILEKIAAVAFIVLGGLMLAGKL